MKGIRFRCIFCGREHETVEACTGCEDSHYKWSDRPEQKTEFPHLRTTAGLGGENVKSGTKLGPSNLKEASPHE